jgi:hypothetical protein
LREGQAQEMIQTGEALHLMVALVALHATVELLQRQQRHDLRENRFASMHSSKLAWNPSSPFKSVPPPSRCNPLHAGRLLVEALTTLGH